MSRALKLMGVGLPSQIAQQLAGDVSLALTAAGSSQGTALAAPSDINVSTTTAASTGIILPGVGMTAGDEVIVVNFGASALAVYPPVGGKLDNVLNTACTVAANKNVRCISLGGLDYISIIKA